MRIEGRDGNSAAEGVCPRCNGRLPVSGSGSAVRLCPWCDAVLDGSATPDRGAKRAAVVGVVGVVLGAWALIVPGDKWTAIGGLVFGVIAVFMIAMAWVLSGSIVDP